VIREDKPYIEPNFIVGKGAQGFGECASHVAQPADLYERIGFRGEEQDVDGPGHARYCTRFQVPIGTGSRFKKIRFVGFEWISPGRRLAVGSLDV
jgi:hypothetical protein